MDVQCAAAWASWDNGQRRYVCGPDRTHAVGGYLSGLHYDAVTPAGNTGPTFSKYVVHGEVVDDTGNGVWGIAVSVGGETVISDENGEFFLHVKSAKPLPLSVDAKSSLQTRRWLVDTAPESVRGSLEGASEARVRIALRFERVLAERQELTR